MGRSLQNTFHAQERLIEEKTLPERLSRDRLISEARIAAFNIPLLGETLIEMGLIRKEQLEEALMNQDGAVNVYRSLKSEKLAAAIEIGFILNSTLSIPEILGKILRQVNRVVHAVASTLMLIDVKTGELVFSVPTGPKSDKLVDIRIPPGKGIAGKQETTLEIDSVRKDGRTVPYELKAALIRKNDKIVAVQTILRNIYERKQMEGKLVQEKEKLKDALEKVKTLRGLIPICPYL